MSRPPKKFGLVRGGGSGGDDDGGDDDRIGGLTPSIAKALEQLAEACRAEQAARDKAIAIMVRQQGRALRLVERLQRAHNNGGSTPTTTKRKRKRKSQRRS